MTVNVEAMEQTLAYIEENPHQWNQESWGSCFAGITVHLHGSEVDCCIGCTALEILGLKMGEEGGLFESDNTLNDLRRIVATYRRDAAPIEKIVFNVSTDREMVAV